MKLVIDGREYDGDAQPFIGDLRLLKPAFGFGYDVVIRRLQKMDDIDNGDQFLELLGDDEFLEAFVAWMWLSRLRAGERELTLDEVWRTPLDAVQMIGDADDEEPGEEESVPPPARTVTDPGGSEAPAQAAATPPPKPRSGRKAKSSTRTSKKPSTRG